MKTITSEQLKRRQEKCSQGKHKYRQKTKEKSKGEF